MLRISRLNDWIVCLRPCREWDTLSRIQPICLFIVIYLPPINEEVNVFARVCLSVCLLARLLKNACTDLNEMLRVDRCRDMDELINFWARSGLYSLDAGTGLLSPISDALQREILLPRENPTYRYWAPVATAKRGFKMVLFTACLGNTFVGGTCALPSARLVFFMLMN